MEKFNAVLTFICIALGVAVWLLLMWGIDTDQKLDGLKKEAIAHHSAYYHPTSGEFTWGKP